MALIKCSECGADISTEAVMCPHCGKPNIAPKNDVLREEPKPRSSRAAIFVLTVSFLGVIAWFVLQFFPSIALQARYDLFLFQASHDILFVFQHSRDIATASQPEVNPGTEVPLQEVKNLGYDFYLGQIEGPGVNDINDDVKNQITKVAYDTHFPIRLLRNTPIIILNNLALTGDQYVRVQGFRLQVPELKGDFLSEGGLYAPYATNTAVIFINKSTITKGQLTDVLAHELGHAIGSTLTDSQWETFYQLRNIPAGAPRAGTNWNLSPQEDFAEVYKNTFTGADVRTFYGLLMPTMDLEFTCEDAYQRAYDSHFPAYDANDPLSWMESLTGRSKIDIPTIQSEAAADPKVQACRRTVLSDPAKYKSDWSLGIPYKSTVGPKTKQFIETLAASSSSL